MRFPNEQQASQGPSLKHDHQPTRQALLRQLPVTSLCFLSHNLVLSGSGSSIRLYSIPHGQTLPKSKSIHSRDPILSYEVFPYQRIHRIVLLKTTHDSANNNNESIYHVALCAREKAAYIVLAIRNNDLTDKKQAINESRGIAQVMTVNNFRARHWLLDVAALENDTLLFVSVYNILYIVDKSHQGSIEDCSIIHAQDQSLLWSAAFSKSNYETMDQISLVVGTTMLDIFVWNPGKSSNIRHCLRGHKGTIFGVSYSPNGNIIASVSDDRTLRLWKLEDSFDVSPLQTLWGHEGRIWRCDWISNGRIVTVGEDSRVFAWKSTTSDDIDSDTMIKKDVIGSEHEGHGIWSVATYETGGLVATGGADASIQVASVDTANSSLLVPDELQYRIKSFDVSSKDGRIVILDVTGTVYLCTEPGRSIALLTEKDLATLSCTLDFIPGTQTVLLTSKVGDYFCFDTENILNPIKRCSLKCSVTCVFFFLNKDFTCVVVYNRKDNRVDLWKFLDERNTLEHMAMVPIGSKAIQLLSVTFSISGKYLYLGLRDGQILEFQCGSNHSEVFMIDQINPTWAKKVHNEGISNMRCIDDNDESGEKIIESIGRDGHIIRTVFHSSQNPVMRSSTRLSRGWMERFISFGSEIFVASFFGTNCIISNLLGEQIALFECPSFPSKWKIVFVNGKFVFIATAGRKRVSVETSSTYPGLCHSIINRRGHGREIRCTDFHCCETTGTILIATGSEDGVIRISILRDDGNLVTRYRNPSIWTTIKTLNFLKTSEGLFLLIGGGRMLFAIFSIFVDTLNEIYVNEVTSAISSIPTDDTRIMACDYLEDTGGKGKYTLVYGLSNGDLQIRNFDSENTTLQPPRSLIYSEKRCVLSVKAVKARKLAFAIVGSTDGMVRIFCSNESLNAESASISIRLHQSGINALDVLVIENVNALLIITGGDDNSVKATRVEYSVLEDNKVSFCKDIIKVENGFTHAVAVQDIQIIDRTTMISIAQDQKLITWEINSTSASIQPIHQIRTEISDCSTICAIFPESGFSRGHPGYVVVTGIGLEIWSASTILSR